MAALRGLMGRVPVGAVGALATVAGLGYVASESVFTVEGGHRAVMFSRISGVEDTVFAEGMHFRIPWFQYPIIYDIRSKPHRISSPTGTKDLQMVNISLRVLSRPQTGNLPLIFKNLGTDYDERVLPSIVNEVVKSIVSRFNAAQLITQRESVSRLIRDTLRERAQEFWLVLDDVSITDLTFSPEYTAAVEAKQVAQQNAQRAVLIVEKSKQERQQKIVEAEGEAQSAALIGKAIQQNPGFLQLRKIDAAREIAQTIANSANRVYLDSNSLLLNVEDHGSDMGLSNGSIPTDGSASGSVGAPAAGGDAAKKGWF